MQSTDDKTHRKPPDAVEARRRWLGVLGIGGLALAWARTVPARDRPLRLACDPDLFACGLVPALVQAFARDTGLAVAPVRLGIGEALEETQAGRCDAVLSASPERDAPWVEQGLLHGERPVARLRWVLVGPMATRLPAGPGAPAPAGTAGGGPVRAGPVSTDVLGSLQALGSQTDPQPLFLLPAEDTASRALVESLWREAALSPAAPWRQTLADGLPLLATARERAAWALVGGWEWAGATSGRRPAPAARPAQRSAPGPEGAGPPVAPWGLVADHDPRLTRPVRALRAFRSAHPAGRLFSDWVAGAAARRALRGLPGVLPGTG